MLLSFRLHLHFQSGQYLSYFPTTISLYVHLSPLPYMLHSQSTYAFFIWPPWRRSVLVHYETTQYVTFSSLITSCPLVRNIPINTLFLNALKQSSFLKVRTRFHTKKKSRQNYSFYILIFIFYEFLLPVTCLKRNYLLGSLQSYILILDLIIFN